MVDRDYSMMITKQYDWIKSAHSNRKKVVMTNINTGEKIFFESCTALARHFKIPRATASQYICNKYLWKKTYRLEYCEA